MRGQFLQILASRQGKTGARKRHRRGDESGERDYRNRRASVTDVGGPMRDCFRRFEVPGKTGPPSEQVAGAVPIGDPGWWSSLQLEVPEASGGFAAFEAAAEALGLLALGALFFAGHLFLGPQGALEGEADLALVGVHAEDLDVELLADLEGFLGLLDLLVGDFGDVEQAFEAGLEFHE